MGMEVSVIQDKEQDQEYNRMRGEYLSLMASLEFYLTLLMVEYRGVRRYREEFEDWFTKTPIPFGLKIRLFEAMLKDSYTLEMLGDIPGQIRDSNGFRNTLAHSFRQSGETTTARGRKIPAEEVTFEVLEEKLDKLRSLDSLVLDMLVTEYQGTPQPVFTEDYADWPL